MKLKVLRFNSAADHTNGLFFIDDSFVCFTLEDEARTKKVFGETCIPDGIYDVELRNEGTFSNRYGNKFGRNYHKGMLHIKNVPGFEHILIHIGNTDEDTAGCLLLGLTASGNNFIGDSTAAYKKVYPKVRDAILNKEKVTIDYITLG